MKKKRKQKVKRVVVEGQLSREEIEAVFGLAKTHFERHVVRKLLRIIDAKA